MPLGVLLRDGHGPNAAGLVCGFLFSPGEAARPIDLATAAQWLSRPRDEHGEAFLWLHFGLSDAHAEKWLAEHMQLPEEYVASLRETSGSTRVELADGYMIAAINDVSFDFSYDASQIATLWMCLHDHVVVSARLHSLRSVDRLRVAVRNGEQFSSPVALLVHLLRDQADVLQQIGGDAAKRVDRIEDNLLAGRVGAKRSTLGAMRRVFVRLRRLLAPEPGALFRLLSRPPAWLDEDDVQDLRAATEEFSAVLSDLAALQERTRLLQEEMVSHATEQTQRSVYLLTVMTVLALPINLTAGLMGMNVGGIPFSEHPMGFWIVLGLIATFTALGGWLARSRRPQ